MLCSVVDPSPLITGGCPEKSLPARGFCACAKWTWNMPRWITESLSAPLAVLLHDNPKERKRKQGGEKRRTLQSWETRPTTFLNQLSSVYYLLLALPLFDYLPYSYKPTVLVSLSICVTPSVFFFSLLSFFRSLKFSTLPPAWNRLL